MTKVPNSHPQAPDVRLATLADALTWTDAASDVIFVFGGDFWDTTLSPDRCQARRNAWSDLRVWDIAGRLTAWTITSTGPEGADDNCGGLTEPLVRPRSSVSVSERKPAAARKSDRLAPDDALSSTN